VLSREHGKQTSFRIKGCHIYGTTQKQSRRQWASICLVALLYIAANGMQLRFVRVQYKMHFLADKSKFKAVKVIEERRKVSKQLDVMVEPEEDHCA
jgi:hypothetical protein